MTTAMDSYSAMMRDRVVLGLRQMGFTGSGQSFKLRDPNAWRLLGIQKSTGNTRDRVKFTVNLTVVGKADWERIREQRLFYPATPSPNVCYGGAGYWNRRIGKLMPAGQDHWWELTERTDPDHLAATILTVIKDYALPALAEDTTAHR